MAVEFTCGEQDWLSSIAELHGHLPETIWDHPNNSDLRAKREHGNVLRPGDVLYIPDVDPKAHSCGTDRRHRFRLKGVPEIFRVRLLDERGYERVGLPYTLIAGSRRLTGFTDAEGRIEAYVPTYVREGKLEITDRDQTETYDVSFSSLRPDDGEDGVRQRLVNLGYLGKDTRDAEIVSAALRAFQDEHELAVTGSADADTVEALERLYRGED